MRWQLIQHSWPFGQWNVEVGTILDTDNPIAPNGVPLPSPLEQRIPINVLCLDQAAADAWKARYNNQLYLFHGVPGLT
jgi:hypothetical protein